VPIDQGPGPAPDAQPKLGKRVHFALRAGTVLCAVAGVYLFVNVHETLGVTAIAASFAGHLLARRVEVRASGR